MKKIMALAIATTMLMLVGCGNKTDSSVADVPASSETVTEATTEPASEATTTTEAETTVATEAPIETTTKVETPIEPVEGSVTFENIEKIITKAMNSYDDTAFADETSGFKICDGIIAEFEANGVTFGEYNDPAQPDSDGRSYNADTKTGGELIRSVNVAKMCDTPIAMSDVEGLSLTGISCSIMHDQTFEIDDRYTTLTFDVSGDDLWAGHKVYSNLLKFFKENGYTDADNEATSLDEALKFANEAYAPMSYNSLTCNLKNDSFPKIQFFPNSSTLEIVFYK